MATYTDNYNLTKPTMNELADIRVINGNMDSVDEIMHGSQVSIADAYDPTLTYDVGDFVMNDFLLYKCVTAVTVPEAFDVNKWTRVTAIGEMPTDTFTGATSQTAGSKGLVPAPSAGDQNKYLKANGTWDTPSSGGGGGIDYSTTEQNTGLKWIDGKDIYQITFQKTASDFSGTTSTTNLASLNVDLLIDAKGMFTSGSGAGEFIAPLPYVEPLNVSTSSINMFFLTQSKDFCVRKSNTNYNVSSFFFTVWYTKTTS